MKLYFNLIFLILTFILQIFIINNYFINYFRKMDFKFIIFYHSFNHIY
jgi:hypothetical protein